MLYDLLVPNSAELDLREDASGNPVICGCRSIPIQSADQVMEWLSTGNRRRTQEATAANVTSSRSHALLEVKVERKESSVRQDISEEYTVGSLFMCDLAGSERAAQTKNTGQRMVEGQHINRSLLALGNCINSISAGDKYVNFRDSKLTRLLKEAFSGNSRTIMIAHVSPASFHFEESFNTLNYANRAKNIKTRTSKNVFSVQAHITEYAQIVEGLKLQVAQLKLELAQHEGQTRGPSAASRAGGPSAEGGAPRSHEDGGATGGPSEKDTSGKELRAQLRTAFAAQLEAQQRLLALQEENLALAVEMNDKTLTIEEWEQNRFLQVPLPSEGEDPLPVAAAREDMAVLVERSDGMLAKKAEVQEEVRGHRAAVDEMTQGLPERVTNKGRLRLLQSLQRIHDLEADKLQLRLAGKVSEVALASKDCIVERLLRQISFRDAVIAEQRKQLSASSVEPTDKLKQLYDGLKLQKAGRLTPLPGAASSSYPFSEVTSPLPVIGASAPPPVAEWGNGGDGPVDLRSTFTVQDRAALPISPEFEPIPEELPAGGLRRSGGRSEHPLHSTPPTPRGAARGGGKEAPMSIGRPVNASDVARPSPLKARWVALDMPFVNGEARASGPLVRHLAGAPAHSLIQRRPLARPAVTYQAETAQDEEEQGRTRPCGSPAAADHAVPLRRGPGKAGPFSPKLTAE